jgi:ATP:corrinoid adenosyltransferase
MCSSLRQALLAARTGGGRRSERELDQVWAALSPTERGLLEREVDALARRGVGAELGPEGPVFHVGPYAALGGGPMLAVCGAREAGGVELAERAARLAVDAGAAVMTGDAEGPETAALRVTLERGGLGVRVLAEGFAPGSGSGWPGAPAGVGRGAPEGSGVAPSGVPGVRPSGRVRPVGDAAGLVTVSPCAPGQPWSVDGVLARNAVLAGMCTALVAIGAGGTGAVLDAGMRALGRGRPVLAVGATRGTRLLVDYGATAAVDELELTWWLRRTIKMRVTRGCVERPAPRVLPGPRSVWHAPAQHWSTA